MSGAVPIKGVGTEEEARERIQAAWDHGDPLWMVPSTAELKFA